MDAMVVVVAAALDPRHKAGPNSLEGVYAPGARSPKSRRPPSAHCGRVYDCGPLRVRNRSFACTEPVLWVTTAGPSPKRVAIHKARVRSGSTQTPKVIAKPKPQFQLEDRSEYRLFIPNNVSFHSNSGPPHETRVAHPQSTQIPISVETVWLTGRNQSRACSGSAAGVQLVLKAVRTRVRSLAKHQSSAFGVDGSINESIDQSK